MWIVNVETKHLMKYNSEDDYFFYGDLYNIITGDVLAVGTKMHKTDTCVNCDLVVHTDDVPFSCEGLPIIKHEYVPYNILPEITGYEEAFEMDDIMDDCVLPKITGHEEAVEMDDVTTKNNYLDIILDVTKNKSGKEKLFCEMILYQIVKYAEDKDYTRLNIITKYLEELENEVSKKEI